MEEDGKLAANIDIASLATISESVHHLLTVAAAGVDPLVAFSISNSLRSSLGKYNVSDERKLAVTPRFAYTHPTISALTKVLYNLVCNNMSCSAETSVDLQRKTADRFRAKYTAGLGGGHTVILTGRTGSLGSYLLESLDQGMKSLLSQPNRRRKGSRRQQVNPEG